MKIPIVIPNSNIHRVAGGYNPFANKVFDFWGADLMTNGTFPDATDWNVTSANWSIGGGVASYDGLVDSQILKGTNGNGPTTAGEYTRLKFTVSGAVASARIKWQDSAGNQLVPAINYANGDHTVFFTPAGTRLLGIQVRAFNVAGGGAFDIDDIILQELG